MTLAEQYEEQGEVSRLKAVYDSHLLRRESKAAAEALEKLRALQHAILLRGVRGNG